MNEMTWLMRVGCVIEEREYMMQGRMGARRVVPNAENMVRSKGCFEPVDLLGVIIRIEVCAEGSIIREFSEPNLHIVLPQRTTALVQILGFVL
jgi:hypothetical protein